MRIDIDGVERLRVQTDSIAPEAACTSVQFHLQVSPGALRRLLERRPGHRRRAGRARRQLAVPVRPELWRETRIPLFEQATDTRPEELKAQGVRPRVWFGERWITSIFDLFEENVRYFPALLPICDDEDPVEVLDRRRRPTLAELRLHNGTVYRWNRPVYDVVGGRPHLRVENRVLPAGPTVVDIMANAAFYFGLVRALAEEDTVRSGPRCRSAPPRRTSTPAPGTGIDAQVFWPGLGEVPVTELVLRRLLPLAATGLDRWGVDPAERDRLLGIIEQRCLTGCSCGPATSGS